MASIIRFISSTSCLSIMSLLLDFFQFWKPQKRTFHSFGCCFRAVLSLKRVAFTRCSSYESGLSCWLLQLGSVVTLKPCLRELGEGLSSLRTFYKFCDELYCLGMRLEQNWRWEWARRGWADRWLFEVRMFILGRLGSAWVELLQMEHEMTVKIVVVGSVGVGKSTLTLRYVSSHFHDRLESTLGAMYYDKTIQVAGRSIKLLFWDTAGQEKYKAIARIYYKDCRVALLVYDVSNPQSFAAIAQWAQEVQQNSPDNVVLALVGNKVDLQTNNEVPYDAANKMAEELGAIFKYTSAKDGKGVEELFATIVERVMETEPGLQHQLKKDRLSRSSRVPQKKKCC